MYLKGLKTTMDKNWFARNSDYIQLGFLGVLLLLMYIYGPDIITYVCTHNILEGKF